jgi:endonuclease/exonuclease/phosphatase family metal-dependent hydrolase
MCLSSLKSVNDAFVVIVCCCPVRLLELPMFRLLACMIVLFTSVADADEPLRLRVLSYNVHHCEGVDGRLDVARIAKVINDRKPDLVALQEVDKNCKRSATVDQPEQLAKLTGLHVVFGRNIDLQGGEYGNAVLSRWPVTGQKNHVLPCLEEGEQRGALAVEIDVPQGSTGNPATSLTFISTHLDHRKPDKERLQSVDVINNLPGVSSNRLMILAGDLNATPESAVLDRVRKTWTLASSKPHPTVPVHQPKIQIDYIATFPSQRWKVLEFEVLDEAVASDHRAVFSVIELTP